MDKATASRAAAATPDSLIRDVASMRARGVASRLEARTVGDLARFSARDFLAARNCGRTTAFELAALVFRAGLRLRITEIKEWVCPSMAETRVTHASKAHLSDAAEAYVMSFRRETLDNMAFFSVREMLPRLSSTAVDEIGHALAVLGLRLKTEDEAYEDDVNSYADLRVPVSVPEYRHWGMGLAVARDLARRMPREELEAEIRRLEIEAESSKKKEKANAG